MPPTGSRIQPDALGRVWRRSASVPATGALSFTIALWFVALLTTTQWMASAQTELSPLDHAVAIYAELTETAVLRSASLVVSADVELSRLPLDKVAAIARIESIFATNGIAVVRDGPHFVRLFPAARGDLAKSPPLRGAEVAKVADQAVVPAGTIYLSATPLEQALQLYVQLRSRTILRPGRLTPISVSFTNACALTRTEVVYAFTTVFELNDLAVVDDGDHFTQMVPKAQLGQVKAKAPRARSEDPLLVPQNVPAIGCLRSYGSAPADLDRSNADWEAARSHCADRLLAYYGQLTGQKAIPSPTLGNRFLYFATETPLSKAELLYAVETTFALNQLAVIAEKDGVGLGEVPPAGK